MKNSYISAMNKIIASDALRDKTLAAMNHAQNNPTSKTIKFNKKYTIIAACAVFALCVPAAAYLLDFNNTLGAKKAPQMTMAQQEAQPSASQEAKLKNDGEAGAMPRAAAFGAKEMHLTEEKATELLLEGAAFIDGSTQAGGYETEGMVVNFVEINPEAGAYIFNVTDKNGKELVLLVY